MPPAIWTWIFPALSMRLELDHDRSVSIDVSLGAFSFDQGSSEDAVPTENLIRAGTGAAMR